MSHGSILVKRVDNVMSFGLRKQAGSDKWPRSVMTGDPNGSWLSLPMLFSQRSVGCQRMGTQSWEESLFA
ncbi:hypothetical protein [Leptospirillum ferrooxidans]|uniref:hypothetical protein n=1 Tax=Leptospirillum ferrooxidans TaxID=180 RepID=UPI0011D28E99|nr:hypothetical protein [Leptospirillum ferrooxidans]